MEDLNVAAAGMGVNTIAYLILCTQQGIIFDHILFSDPGSEHPDTYKYIDYFNIWLSENGQPQIKTLRKVTKHKKVLSLYDDNINIKSLPSIVYGYKKCSLKYKVGPFEKFLNSDPIAKKAWANGTKVRVFKGIDCDEEHRAIENPNPKLRNIYPLIDAEMGRFECIKLITDNGLLLPPKSSCTFCPSMKPWEIIELYENNRTEFYRAIAMERNAKENLTSIQGLGRDFSWWDLIVAYRYLKFIKRSPTMVAIPLKFKKLIKKINKSKPDDFEAIAKSRAEVKNLICDLFTVKVGESCDCMS